MTANATSPVPPASSEERRQVCLAISLTAVVLYLTALCLPLATAAKFGESRSSYIYSGAKMLWLDGDWHLAILITVCGIVVPFGLMGILCTLLITLRRRLNSPFRRRMLNLALKLERWSMPEVQILGIMVAFTKLSALVPTRPDAGLWCYGLAAFCSLLSWRIFQGGIWVAIKSPGSEGPA